jgi:ribosomal protein S18 acetylase RimI-like enzyme
MTKEVVNKGIEKSQSSDIKIRSVTINDLQPIAKVHVAAFPKSALTKLGLGAVYRYYHWQLTGPHRCVALGAWQNDNLCGFSFGGRFNGALSGFLKTHRWYLLTKVISKPWLMFHPWFRERIVFAIRGLFRRQSTSLTRGSAGRTESFGILAIAVAPTAKRKGIGSLLMEMCEESAISWNANRMHLTVAVHNIEAIKFYEALGWQQESSTGKWTGTMVKQIPRVT